MCHDEADNMKDFTRCLKRPQAEDNSDNHPENHSPTFSQQPPIKCDLPASIKLSSLATKTVTEQPLPDPFPLPTNYRDDVQLALKGGK